MERTEGTITAADVAIIHGIEDDSTRNNEITLGYHDLSEVLARVTRSESANWCAWAKWTSKTIGVGIRWGEARDIARAKVDAEQDKVLNRWAASRAVRWFLAGSALRMLGGATRMASRHLADGNRDVFYEVGTAVTAMAERFEHADELDAAALEEYVASLDHTHAPAGSLGPAPLDHLKESMRCFVLARFAGSEAERDQLVLTGNVHLAAYEQLRLQPVVCSSLWAPVDFWFRPVAAIGRRIPARVRRPLGAPPRAVRDRLRWVAVRVATRYVLVVITKDEVVRLGKPMRPATGAAAVFPPPDDVVAVDALGTAFDELVGDADLARALSRVWTTYPERVRFTAVLFRSRHHHPSLRDVPMVGPERHVVDAERTEAAEDGERWARLA
jgi:hypothetical protein